MFLSIRGLDAGINHTSFQCPVVQRVCQCLLSAPTHWRSHGRLPVGQSCTRLGLWMAPTSSFVTTQRLCVPSLTSAVTAPTVCWWHPAMTLVDATEAAELTPKTQVKYLHPNKWILILQITLMYLVMFCNGAFILLVGTKGLYNKILHLVFKFLRPLKENLNNYTFACIV